ncbi:MAG: hydroxypyruvate isomerase [Lautropia sp.]|nr:MAG: hydroxypyruvate isomerase [Pseudomonadota bacterium]MBC6959492.1 hydroxypyruvate isomerase [Lautropia sp.]MCL4702623.1 hydroxypyruvate isomerase family protein [Burkholderiaceae bacterium]MCZ2415066.1 hydroxypyruvate isomerase family protein [Burkholderiales bacterium]MDL1906690.1 hydroxypyruvate isomerase family protein [Betaproteobacteria bacterium PRO1]
MPRFAANLSLMYTELPFLQRFEAAAADGFRAAEFLFPYEFAAAEVAAALRASGLRQVLFNAPPGDLDRGDRGTCSLPGREAEFRTGVERAIGYAAALECPRLHLMAGVAGDEARRAGQRATYVANLRWAARRLAREGITALIEPINTRDVPGYLLETQAEAHAIVAEVGESNLKVQMDLYHCQIVEGDVATKIRRYLDGVGHVQIAGVPERHEPDTGELNYPYLFALIDELGYEGWIGCEYRPRGATRDGLGWIGRWL